LVTGLINIFEIIYNQIILSIYTELAFIVICGLLCLCFILYLRKFDHKVKENINVLIKNLFLIGLLLIAATHLRLDFIDNFRLLSSGIEFLSIHLFYLILITTTFGVITLYFERDMIIKEVKNSKDHEIQAEKKRKKELEAKYNRMPLAKDKSSQKSSLKEKNTNLAFLTVLKRLGAWCLRLPHRVYSWFYIEGWWYSAGLVLILVSGSIIQLSIIGDYYFWTDEVFSFNAGKMILEKGEPLFDSGLFYGRARIYHYLIAGSMYFFGIDEFGSRIINVFFNIATALIIYQVLKGTSKKIAIFGAFLFMFSNLTLVMTIETRFYGLFTLAFLGMAFTYYKVFVENINDDFYNNIIKKIKDDRKWLFLFLMMTYLAYNTHNFFFIIIFGLALYYLLALVLVMNKSWQTNLFFLLCCVGMIFAGAYYYSGTFDLYYAYLEKVTLDWAADRPRRPDYYTSIMQENLPFYYLLLTTSVALLLTRVSQRQSYYFALVIAGLIIISPQRQVAERYMFFLIPLVVIVIAYSFYYLYRCFRKHRFARTVIIMIIVVFTLSQLQLFAAEVNQEYDNGRLARHKKHHFYEVMAILDNTLNEEYILLADYHAAFTLLAHGYEVKYIVISEDREHTLNRGIVIDGVVHDHYFKIPFLIQESDEYVDSIKNKRLVIVERGDIKTTGNYSPLTS